MVIRKEVYFSLLLLLATVAKSITDNEIAKGIDVTITGENNVDGTNINDSVHPSITIPYGGLRLGDQSGKSISFSDISSQMFPCLLLDLKMCFTVDSTTNYNCLSYKFNFKS